LAQAAPGPALAGLRVHPARARGRASASPPPWSMADWARHDGQAREGAFDVCCCEPNLLDSVETIDAYAFGVHGGYAGYADIQAHAREARLKWKKGRLSHDMNALEASQEVVDVRYKNSTEELLDILKAEEDQARHELEAIQANRAALKEQVDKWKGERDHYETELVHATRLRVCRPPDECVVS